MEFVQGFGMTEMPSITYLLPEDHRPGGTGKLRSVGVPGYGYEIRVVDADGKEVPRGTIGEIVGRGPCVMAGYWNRPEETAQALRSGWMHSQDAGFMDAGRLCPHHRPDEGHDRLWRGECLFGRG
jgi:long-chain acyl-CoA synthetase